MQFDRAMGGSGHRLQRAHGEREAGEVAFADGGGAAVQAAVFDFSTIGVVLPAVAGGHHVAVGVQRHAPARAVLAPHDQVGDGFHAVVPHLLRGDGVRFGFKAHFLEQFGGADRVRGVVAGRRVGGYAHQRLQEAHLLVEVGVDPGV
ncbi:hypothetical protein D3C72_1213690 [compost metagenome]